MKRYQEIDRDCGAKPAIFLPEGHHVFYMERSGSGVETVVDINPAKQGKFLPTTGD